MKIRKNSWHFSGTRMRIHKILGRKKDDIGWMTLCGKHVNGISTTEEEIPSKYPERVCNNCWRLSLK